MGISTNKPVFTKERSKGAKVMGWSILALTSMPAEALVSYFGKGSLDLLMILICIV
jgi:hypothetical protein